MAEENNSNNNGVTTPAQRRASCEAYIDSPAFGLDTWVTLAAINENVNDVIDTMRLYYDQLRYLDEDFLAANLPQQPMLRLKQHIVLDLILKAQIIVESSLVLIHALPTNGYRGLTRTMVRYGLEHVNNHVLVAIWENDLRVSLLRYGSAADS